MRAIATPSYGPLEQIQSMDLPVPEPQAGQVRLRVHASAINPSELKVATGKVKFLHARKFPLILGYDISGVVEQLGPGAKTFAVGDEVFGFLPYNGSNRWGAFAEEVVASEGWLARKPAGMSHELAAAVATAGATALQSLRDHGRLAAGGRTLIIGASGGVGSIGIGVAKKLGAHVTAVCSTQAVELLGSLGADEIIDRKQHDYLKAAKGPFDVVFDAAAASSWGATRHLLGRGGTYVTTLPSLAFVLNLPASLFSSTRVRLVVVKSKPDDLALLGRWIEEGLKVPIDSSVPVRDVVSGMRRLDRGAMMGRITVTVRDGF
jgi:NADPH2:quinone reductase